MKIKANRLREFIDRLSETMSVSGYEFYDAEKLLEIASPLFDEHRCDAVGNHLFIKKSGRKDAEVLLIDTHYDEIGMIVTDICEGGFLTVTNIGGIDTGILPAAGVMIYGKEKLRGVVAQTPPHLIKDKADKLLEIEDIRIDTGYSTERLRELVSVGTPIGFEQKVSELCNGYICGKGFDNKVCVAAALAAIDMLGDEKPPCDVCLLLSAKEETSLLGGRAGAYGIDPDCAIVMDVNLAYMPDTKKEETVVCGAGASVSISALTDRALTNKLIETAVNSDIPHQIIVEPTNTGTNANVIPLVRYGIPTAVMSIPLKNMHTACETFKYSDAESAAMLLNAFISGRGEN